MMGGKSSSSSSQSTSTSQVDKRIGATDNALVVMNEGESAAINITPTDYGALDGAREIVLEVLDLTQKAQTGAFESIKTNQGQTQSIINDLRTDTEERITRLTTQWAGIVAVVFLLTWGLKRARA